MEPSSAEFMERVRRTRDFLGYQLWRLSEMMNMMDEIGLERQKADTILVTVLQIEQVKEITTVIELLETNKVHLEELPNLRSFFSGDLVEWPSLDNVVVNECPNLKKFGLGKIKWSQLKSVTMENQVERDINANTDYLFETSMEDEITEYSIDKNEDLSKAIDNLQAWHFINLQFFHAKSCDEKVNTFLSILVKRSKKLEAISIEQCKTFIFLFDTEDARGFVRYGGVKCLTQLKELKLAELYELWHIWGGNPAGVFGFENLQKIEIKSCPSLRLVLDSTIVDTLQQLNELKLEACAMLHEIVYVWKDETNGTKLRTLSTVEFKSLSILKRFCEYHLEFPSLETLMIEKCPQLEEFATGFATANSRDTTDGKSFYELNEVKLDSCDELVVVVSSKTLQELQNLKKLNVSHCKKLEKVFNISEEIFQHSTELLQKLDELILIDLPSLTHIINREFVMFYKNLQILQVKQCESLTWLPGSLLVKNMEISDCGAMKKIMIIDKEEETKRKATFSQLKDVTLENLTNLSLAFPSTSEFPSLKTLKVANCPSLLTFVEESNESKDCSETSTSNYFFPDSLSLDKLKVLYIANQDVEKLWNYNCPSESFCELENLTLSNNNKLLSVISSSIIIRFNKLKKMTLDKCELLTEVFSLDDEKLNHNIQEMLPQLMEFALSNLSSLRCISSKEPQVPLFPNLVSLFIVHCASLESLFSITSVKNLRKLKLLRICNCEKLKEVIFGDKDENISFPEMESLVLKDLPQLVNFYHHGGTFDLPNLQIVRVNNIPSMKTFSSGILNTPLLRSIYRTFAKKYWRGNLNNTLSYMHNNSVELHHAKKDK